MGIRILGAGGHKQKDIFGTVCIVGAGIAGLIAATRLARLKRHHVILLESGLRHVDPAIKALNEIDNCTGNYNGAMETRLRGLGGTSLLWAGKLLPLSHHDTVGRAYLSTPGWPFDIAELEPYRHEIESFMGVDTASYEETITDMLDPRRLLARDDPDFCLRWPKRPSSKRHNLAYVFRREIESCDNLEIWLGATVIGFDFDGAAAKLRSVTISSPERLPIKVIAQEFMLTAGTLESTRLLLLADRQSNHVISRTCGTLGRYFNDHFGLEAALLRPLDRTSINRILGDRMLRFSLRHLHFELRASSQQQSEIGSAYFDVGVELPPSSSLTACRNILNRVKRGKRDITFEQMKFLVKDAPSLLHTAEWQWLRGQQYWPRDALLPLKIWVEQLPHWQNRLSLSDRTDALQVPMLKVELTKTDSEEKTFRAMVEKIDCYWKRRLDNVCRLEWKPEISQTAHRIVDLSLDQAHPAGSTRMGISAAESVVDKDLKVHSISNLSVASASVFPTSGSANPTFTVMQLAMRATDAMVRRLDRSPGR